MTLESRVTYRFTFNQLVKFLEKIAQPPQKSVKDMKDWNYDRWVFARDARLVRDDQGWIEPTKLGEEFLQSDKATRESIFRGVLLKIDQFAAIWTRVETKSAQHEGVISKDEMKAIIVDSIGTESGRMAEIYRSRLTNWAKNAGLLVKVPGKRAASYRVKETRSFGPMTLVVTKHSSGHAGPKPEGQETSARYKESFMSEIFPAVCELLVDPTDQRAREDLRLLTVRWNHSVSNDEIGETDKKIVLNELESAIDIGSLRAYQMLATTLRIVRRERPPQKRIAEY